jgi:predicted esterase
MCLRRRLADSAELLFADAPHLLVAEPSEKGEDRAPRRTWLLPSAVSDGCDEGWQESLDAILSALAQHSPVHGLLGFSQGAATAFLTLHRLLSDPSLLPCGVSMPSFLIAASGYAPPSCLMESVHGFALPSLHIIGESDVIVSPSLSLALVEQCQSPLLLRHVGGHLVPSGRQHVRVIAAFLDGARTAAV